MSRRLAYLGFGKKGFQWIFEGLFRLSTLGMNMGLCDNQKENGEAFVLSYVKGKVPSGMDVIILDVGANEGKYSLLSDEIFGGKARVYSFEPSQKAFEKLCSNIKEKESVTPYRIALGARNRQDLLYSDRPGSPLSSLYKRDLEYCNISLAHEEQVKVKTIDGFCRDESIKRVHLLKLDAEGNELNILQGARKMLDAGSIDFIQFEFGGCDIDSRVFFKDFYLLLSPQYRIYRVLADGLRELKRYSEAYEVFKTTNFLAERKV